MTGEPGRATVRVAVAQLVVPADHAAARDATRAAIVAAAEGGADLVVLPEYASGFDPRGVGREHAEPLDGPFVTLVREVAADVRVAVLVGTTAPGVAADRASNVVVAVGPDGALRGSYRKVHLYDAYGQLESDRLEAGPADAEPLVLDVGGLRFGVLTCYDLRFPEIARRVVDAGAEVLVVPAAWAAGPGKADHWRALAVARAIENTSVVVAVGQTGLGVVGRSVVVGADGVVVLELDEEPAVATVDLDPEQVRQARDRDPSLVNRRYTVVPG
ncbi:2-oxoglutaramate amidase [mine drainage metagenome]|uniref:2-oxoglutaramate amidase n=1 Tax=mine drainage metagenome TaxID=410659 RepID=A0A1J5R3Y8_9ZZZZ